MHTHRDTLRTSGAQSDQWRCWEFLTVLDNVLIKLLLCLTLVSSCGLLWSVSLYQFTQTITFSCYMVTVIEQRGILGLEKLNMCLLFRNCSAVDTNNWWLITLTIKGKHKKIYKPKSKVLVLSNKSKDISTTTNPENLWGWQWEEMHGLVSTIWLSWRF